MCTDGTPGSPYLAKWSCTIQAAPAPDVAVARTAAWARATMHNWGLGGLAGDVGLIVAEFCSNAWTHGSPPVVVTLLLQDSVLTVEVSDAGRPGGVRRAAPARRGRPRPPHRRRHRASRSESTAGPGARGCGHGCASSGYPSRPSPEPRPPERDIIRLPTRSRHGDTSSSPSPRAKRWIGPDILAPARRAGGDDAHMARSLHTSKC